MAEQIKITDLNEADTVKDTDYLIIDDGIETKKATKSALFDSLGLYVSNGYLCQKVKGE